MKWLFIISLMILLSDAAAQDSAGNKNQLAFSGYIKNLQSFSFDKNFTNLISGNLLHNRMNIKWKPSEKITAAAEFRNRLFWGEEIKTIPGFASLLKNENDFLDLQKAWVKKNNLILHSNIERLWVEYRKPKWNIRMGRQRINWGITTTWNPNDIFNTYNFLDFDYEERPGSDAVKIQYLLSDFSHTELAVGTSGKKNRTTSAVKYFLNKGGYDYQFIAGWYQNQLTAGAGWAGSIKDAGFKGELQYFIPMQDSSGQLNVSLETDYVFKNGWYVNAGFLFNSEGFSNPIDNWQEISFQFSPKNLMPTKWNFISTVAKEFTPLLSGNISVLYAPGTNLLIVLPAIKYNMATNLDADLIWQGFFTEIQNSLQAFNHRVFIRLKFSF